MYVIQVYKRGFTMENDNMENNNIVHSSDRQHKNLILTYFEFGRSMVEMLGVLAIMGVLTYGVVSGLKSAFDKHKANSIIQAISRRATVLSADKALGSSFSSDDSFGSDTSYTISCFNTEGPSTFYCTVYAVGQNVCNKVLAMNWKQPTAIAPTTCSDKTNMTFLFGETFNGAGTICNTDDDCDKDCFKCDTQKHTCSKTNCKNNEKCAIDVSGNVWNNALAFKNRCCPPNQQVNGHCCDSVGTLPDGTKTCCWPSSSGCCPIGQFWGANACYSCNDPQRRSDSRTASLIGQGRPCAICPNRLRAGVYCYLNTTPDNPSDSCPDPDSSVINNQCVCPEDKPMQDWDGYCYTCEDAVGKKIRGRVEALSGTKQVAICEACNWAYDIDTCTQCTAGQVSVFQTWTLPDNSTFQRRESGSDTLPDGQVISAHTSRGRCIHCANIKIQTIPNKNQCESCDHTKWTGTSETEGSCDCDTGYTYVVHENGTGECQPN